MKDILKSVGKTVKNVALTVWHVPAVESLLGTLVIRWLGVIGIPTVAATAIYEGGKALIG